MAIDAVDLHTQAYFQDPFPVWERLRHDQPLLHDTVDDRWLLGPSCLSVPRLVHQSEGRC